MITLNKEILLHPDFTGDLETELCEMLEALMDAEFEKGDGTDFDFIDECADAINAIRNGDVTAVLPVISRRDFIKKVSGSSHKSIKAALAVCAALAVIFSANTILSKTQNIDIIQEVSGFIHEFFGGEPEQLETTVPVTTEAQVQTSAPEITGISVETDESFRTEYYVGEEFSSDGIKVFAEYDNGERTLVRINDYTVEVSDTFGTEPKYETVKITAAGFTQTLEVRIIESLETKKLTSIYAIFPEDFDFTAKDLNNIDLSQMQVYAVYSNGDETELTADEYTVDIEIEKNLFKEEAVVTIGYEGCSCSFMVFKE